MQACEREGATLLAHLLREQSNSTPASSETLGAGTCVTEDAL